MPTYQYRCRECGHEFEIQQSFHDDPITTCSVCEQDELRRVISASGVIFKGSGWYIKDSRNERGRRKVASSAEPDSADVTADTTADGTANGTKKGDAKPTDRAEGSDASGTAKEAASGDNAASGAKTKPDKATSGAKKQG